MEPYVQGQTTYSSFSPRAGNARTSWLTGAAPWAYYSATQYMLGIRPEHNGLRIDPCIPKKWEGFKVTRRYRGAIYNIDVKNPDSVSTGIKQVKVDGSIIKGTVLPVVQEGKSCEVEVIMG
jgi:cellobiose phosphorylase